jgi:hypothetical protein
MLAYNFSFSHLLYVRSRDVLQQLLEEATHFRSSLHPYNRKFAFIHGFPLVPTSCSIDIKLGTDTIPNKGVEIQFLSVSRVSGSDLNVYQYLLEGISELSIQLRTHLKAAQNAVRVITLAFRV